MMTEVTIWLCPACHAKLDGGGSIDVDMAVDHTSRRCASCGTPRLQPVHGETHQLVELEHATVHAYGPVYHQSIQGPVEFIRCACGWTAHADDVNVYAAAEQHGLQL